MIIPSILASFFVILLPILEPFDDDNVYFNHGDAVQYGSGAEDKSQTISGFISKAPGTAMMGAMFFLPLMNMWLLPVPESAGESNETDNE